MQHITLPVTAIVTLVALLLSAQAVVGQTPSACGTALDPAFEVNELPDAARLRAYEREFRERIKAQAREGASCIQDVPLNIYIMRRDDGTGGLDINLLFLELEAANAFFAPACLSFSVCAIEYVDDTNLWDFDRATEEPLLEASYHNPDNLNVYFMGELPGLCGYGSFPFQNGATPADNNILVMSNDCMGNRTTFTHEIGHCYGLLHTHEPALGRELVDGSNCTTAGDRVCDTPADPQLSTQNVDQACLYLGTNTDANGQTYQPLPDNIMSYSRRACLTALTPGQMARANFYATQAAVRNQLSCGAPAVDALAVGGGSSTSGCGPVATRLVATGDFDAFQWDYGNDGTVDAQGRVVDFTPAATGPQDIRIIGTRTSATPVSTTKVGLVNYTALPPLPFADDFAVGTTFERWTVNGGRGGLTWKQRTGFTPSSNTGPSADRSGSGAYLYLETTGAHRSNSAATLTGPCITLGTVNSPTQAELVFYYHMYGSSMGELHVDAVTPSGVVADVTPPIIGQQQTSSAAAYTQRRVSLQAFSNQQIQIRFRGVYGGDFRGDIAIDDVTVTGPQAPVPVELVAFTAEGGFRQNLLAWSTASEIGASHFVVERAGADGAFAAIGQVLAEGAATGADYDFADAQATPGETYYRLLAVDFDGSREYSEVRTVTRGALTGAFAAVPNPASGEVSVSGVPPGARVVLYDALGRSFPTDARGDGRIDVSGLPSGLYTVAAEARGRAVATLRLLVR